MFSMPRRLGRMHAVINACGDAGFIQVPLNFLEI